TAISTASDLRGEGVLEINTDVSVGDDLIVRDGALVRGSTQTGALSVSGNSTFFGNLKASGGIKTGGADVDLEGGRIFAANLINSITAGTNVTITGTTANPIISTTGGGGGGGIVYGGGGVLKYTSLKDTQSSITDTRIIFGKSGSLSDSEDLIFDGTTLITTLLSVTNSGASSFAGTVDINGTGTSTIANSFAIDTRGFVYDNLTEFVGIGTSTPTEFFSVNGPAYFSPTSTPSVTEDRLYNSSGDLYWAGSVIGGATTGNWTTDGTHVYRASGNVGVGTSTLSSRLTIWGNDDTTGRGLFEVADQASTTLFTILDNGLIGIGTTTPYSKFSVWSDSAGTGANVLE
ncbi:MAG: hypothetical protein QF535_19590, partial [Anaerolineales bacterium]|nr:hypothetical protein [Anaerolineales bacterium]